MSSIDSGASTKTQLAPCSANARPRRIASSSPATARASVRAVIQKSGPAGRARGRELREVLFERDDALALHVAASLRPHLVLEEAARGAELHELAHGALDVERVAVAGVDVDQHRDVDGSDDVPGGVDHLGLRQQAEVGLAEPRGGQAVARDEDGAEPRLLGELRGERVPDAGNHDGAVAREESADTIHAVAGPRRSMAQIVAALQSHGVTGTHRPSAQLPRDRSGRAARAGRPRRGGRLPADRRPLSPAAAGSRRRRARDAPARGLHAALPGAAAHGGGVRVHGLDDAVPEPRRRRAPRAARRRRRRHDRMAPRAGIPEGRAARELGRRLALRVLSPAGRAAPERRTVAAPSGDRVPLDRIELPPADGLVLLAAHLGEGRSCSTGSIRRSSTRPIRSPPIRGSTCTIRGTATAR
jgi:hypothetical protein